HERFAEPLGQFLRELAREHVETAAGGIGHHDGDGADGIVLPGRGNRRQHPGAEQPDDPETMKEGGHGYCVPATPACCRTLAHRTVSDSTKRSSSAGGALPT